MYDHTEAAFGRLFSIIRQLRSPEGCAWDKAQTPESLRGNIVEEAYECVEAVSSADDENLREELGDLMMLCMMLACIKEQEGAFTLRDVFDAINEKLVRRHPHVFGETKTESLSEIVGRWDLIKGEEKKGKKAGPSTVVGRLPGSLPPLEKAALIQERVSKVGFDWKSPAPVWEKLDEEIGELKQAQSEGEKRRVEDEVGDILFTVVNLARLLGVESGIALQGTNDKFVRRFARVEERLREQGLTPQEAGLSRMDGLWNQIKDEEQNASK